MFATKSVPTRMSHLSKEKHRLGMLNAAHAEVENRCTATRMLLCWRISPRIVFESKNFLGQGNVKSIHQRCALHAVNVTLFKFASKIVQSIFLVTFIGSASSSNRIGFIYWGKNLPNPQNCHQKLSSRFNRQSETNSFQNEKHYSNWNGCASVLTIFFIKFHLILICFVFNTFKSCFSHFFSKTAEESFLDLLLALSNFYADNVLHIRIHRCIDENITAIGLKFVIQSIIENVKDCRTTKAVVSSLPLAYHSICYDLYWQQP